MTEAFNPLAMSSLAHSIVTRMLETDPVPLDTVPRFIGAGLYAIYYDGRFPAYDALSGHDNDGSFLEPIYVGKATPAGGRRGVDVTTKGTPLWKRLREHSSSVEAAGNLDSTEFSVRWLVMEDIWIPLGESALIRRHRPVWNTIVDGFGNHDPGKGRLAGELSRWDTLHPGRPWAHKYQPRPESPAAIEQEISEYLRSRLS
jgi:hypothetical protein